MERGLGHVGGFHQRRRRKLKDKREHIYQGWGGDLLNQGQGRTMGMIEEGGKGSVRLSGEVRGESRGSERRWSRALMVAAEYWRGSS